MSNAKGKIELVEPTIEYKNQVMDLKTQLLNNNEGFDGCAKLESVNSYEEWIDFENRLLKEYGESYVPSTVCLAVKKNDNKLVGIIDYRHELSDFLFNYGGNIGYTVSPTERRKGYGKEMLRLMLNRCKEEGKTRLLLTCDKDNIASSKIIESNGGILDNEVIDNVNLGKSGIIKRYWISLKKRYAGDEKHIENIIKKEEKIDYFKDDNFSGDVYLINYIKVKQKRYVGNDLCICDNNYKWLIFYNYNKRICLTTIYDNNNNIVEWYFDIARKIGKENGIPYEDDMYLDVVLNPNGKVILLDEDEFEDAYDRNEFTKQEYDDAYKVTDDLMKKLQNNQNEMKKFTDYYLYKML